MPKDGLLTSLKNRLSGQIFPSQIKIDENIEKTMNRLSISKEKLKLSKSTKKRKSPEMINEEEEYD